jgi:transcriptional regulator with XRE-family HTH domain
MDAADFRAFRFRHGLSQAALGRALGVGRHMIIEIEQGRAPPSRLLLLALAAHAAGLEPYRGDPEDLRAFREAGPLRIGASSSPARDAHAA